MKAYYVSGELGSILEIEHEDGSLELYDSVAEDVSGTISDWLEKLDEEGVEWVALPLSNPGLEEAYFEYVG